MQRYAVVMGSLVALTITSPSAAVTPTGKVVLPPLSYTVDRAGPGDGAHPKRSDTIVVDYTLTLLDGTVVDSSGERGARPPFR